MIELVSRIKSNRSSPFGKVIFWQITFLFLPKTVYLTMKTRAHRHRHWSTVCTTDSVGYRAPQSIPFKVYRVFVLHTESSHSKLEPIVEKERVLPLFSSKKSCVSVNFPLLFSVESSHRHWLTLWVSTLWKTSKAHYCGVEVQANELSKSLMNIQVNIATCHHSSACQRKRERERGEL